MIGPTCVLLFDGKKVQAMRKATPCAKCGSLKTFSAPTYIKDPSSHADSSLQVVVREPKPAWTLRSKQHMETLYAWVCGDCGYTELYTSGAKELYEADMAAKRQRKLLEDQRLQRPSALLLRPVSPQKDAEPEQLLRPSDETPKEKE